MERKMNIEVRTFGSDKVEHVEINLDDDTQALFEKEDKFWKKQEDISKDCKNHGDNVKFYNDGEHPVINKHCYACSECGGVTQIG